MDIIVLHDKVSWVFILIGILCQNRQPEVILCFQLEDF